MRRGIFWTLLSGFLVLVLATNCKNPNVAGGILHFDQKRYERARETLLKAIQQEPNNAEAYYYLGMSYAELDSTQRARETLEKAKSLPTASEKIKGDIDQALEHYWSVRHNEGLTFAKAAQDAKTQQQAADDSTVAREKAAEARKNFRLALNQFKKARVYNPNKEETPRNMGVCYFNLGQVDSGLIVLKEAQELAPPGEEKGKASQILFRQYRELGDQAAASAERGNVQSLSGAIKFYLEAEKIEPQDADLLFSIGVVYFQLAEGEKDEAKKQEYNRQAVTYFERTIQAKPDDQDALYNAATLYYDLKECDKGLVHAQHALDLDPHQGRYYNILGRLNDCLGRKNELIAGIVFAQALTSGTVIPPENVKAEIEKLGATSDALRKYREEGKPEEIRTFKDTTQADYMCWFYWSRGKALAFYNGQFKYETDFKPVKGEAGPK